MKYTKPNSTTHIIEIPISDFRIILNDSKKKSAFPRNYCNAGFFANFSENGQPLTLPVAHLICDYDATSPATKKYCTERGKFNGNKFTFDSSTWSYANSFYKKPISTLLVNTKSNKVEIKEVTSLPTNYTYAISGIPIMRNGSSINFESDVVSQGWDSSPLYATWHIFVGLKQNSNSIYVIGMQTTTWNMVKTNEAYKKFKELEMYDVIKLDGGGSFYMNVGGKTVASTSEDRRVNTIILFGDEDKSGNDDKINDEDKVKEETKKEEVKTETVVDKSNNPSSTSSSSVSSKPIPKPSLKPKPKVTNKHKKFGFLKMQIFK